MQTPYPARSRLATRSSSDEAPYDPGFGLTSLDRPLVEVPLRPPALPVYHPARPPSVRWGAGRAAFARRDILLVLAVVLPAAFGFLCGGAVALWL